MDYRQFITDFLERKGNADPSSLMDDDMQALMDTARNLEMDERTESASKLKNDNEITDVDELVTESSSLTGPSKPATDPAIFEPRSPESVPDASPTERPVDEPPADFSPDQQVATLADSPPESAPAELTSPPESSDAIPASDGLPVQQVSGASPPEELVADLPDVVSDRDQVDSQDAEATPAPVSDLVRSPAAEIPLAFAGPDASPAQHESAAGDDAIPTDQPAGESAKPDDVFIPKGDSGVAGIEPSDAPVSETSGATPESAGHESGERAQPNAVFLSTGQEPVVPTQHVPTETEEAVASRRSETHTFFPEGREAEFNELVAMVEQEVMSQESGGMTTSIVDTDYNDADLPRLPEITYGRSTESENMDRLFAISSDIQKWSRL